MRGDFQIINDYLNRHHSLSTTKQFYGFGFEAITRSYLLIRKSGQVLKDMLSIPLQKKGRNGVFLSKITTMHVV